MDIRLAIIGSGNMGQRHATTLESIKEASLVAVCDMNAQKAQDMASRFGCKAYSDFAEMLDLEKLDALIICLPPFAHQGQFEAACRKGLHVFIEKPIALTMERAESMVAAARAANNLTQVGFHMRFGTAVKKLKQLVESGQAGQPILFNGRYQCRSLHTPWWMDVNKSGGQIFEQAIHLYDLSRYLCGEPATTQAVMDNLNHRQIPGYTVEDVSASVTRLASGAIAAITATNCAIPGRWDAFADISYENVHVSMVNPDQAVFSYMNGTVQTSEEIWDEPSELYGNEIREFVECLSAGRTTICPIDDGFRSLRWVDAVVRSTSNEKHTPIPV